MEALLKLFSVLFNEVRLNILMVLNGQNNLQASEILEKLNLSQSKLPNLLYHLKMLQKEGLIERDNSRRYFLTDTGRTLVGLIKKLEEVYTVNSSIRLLLGEYPYVKSLTTKLLVKIIMKNYRFDAHNSMALAEEVQQKIRRYNINTLDFNLLNNIILNIMLEKRLYKENFSFTNNHYSIKAKSNMLNLIVNEIPESINYLEYFYIAGLDNFLNKPIDGRVSFKRFLKLLNFKQNNEETSFRLMKQLIEALKDYSGVFSTGVLFSRLDFLNDFFGGINKKEEAFIRAIFSFLDSSKKIAFSVLLSDDESSINMLNPTFLKDLNGGIFKNFELRVEYNRTFNKGQIAKILEFLKEIPSITISRIDGKGSFSSLGGFNIHADYDDTWCISQLISINLPRLAVKNRLDETKIVDDLRDLIKICSKIFVFKQNKMNLKLRENLVIPEEKNIFLINLIGIFETMLLITGSTLKEFSSYKLAREILEDISKNIEEIESVSVLLSSINDYDSNMRFIENDLSEERGFNYGRSLKLILKNYGYTTGIFPRWIEVKDFRDRLALEVPLLSYLKGGYDLELDLSYENLNEEYLSDVLSYFSKYKLRNMTLNTSIYVCESCNKKYLQEQEFCADCMSKRIACLTRDTTGKFSLMSLEDFNRIKMLRVLP